MGKLILENLIPLIFVLITPILLMFVRNLIKLAAKKWNLEWALDYEDKVEELVIKGIRAAEQKSLSAVRTGGPKTAAQEKLQSVMDFVNAELKEHGLPEKAANQLSMLIESKIFDGAAKE